MKTLAVIYNHNMPEITDSLWESLKPYERDDYDLILIDNGSKPEGKSKYTTHETGQNTYFGGALNIALQFFLESDKYDSLLSLNNDLILQGNNFIKTLREEMFKGDYKIISPCVLQLHKDFIEKINQFPDELMYGWGQDVLSGVICEQEGWKVGVVDKCPLIHHSAQTYKEGKSDLDLTTYCRNAEGGMFNYFQNKNLMDKFNEFRHLSSNYKY